jgi:hypothetical protein
MPSVTNIYARRGLKRIKNDSEELRRSVSRKESLLLFVKRKNELKKIKW